ncbi:MAG: 16S rRNA (adenine(1518)-N(6)/adenine(1519)-N(6))-dimethyltransferase RsmA [Spirulinaceae cyanobacterium SM2_1_0]|nr:16S rRNA (adenine(1518)-N(6)/adenine(1519)-N(6))-dimethyltransferase RsmA [Spirulinaceae cyanobacterium SM2_1_0]
MPPRKRFAQHWLRSEAVLAAIVAAADLQPRDRVLEIGPGRGALTERLLSEVAALLAVEIDRDLCRQLVRQFGDRNNFLLLEGDILKLELATPLHDFPRFQNPNKVVANIPYNITGPILQRLLGTIAQPATPVYDLMVLLVQQEIADRLSAQPSNKAFGALSVRVQYLATCEQICSVPASAFQPKPQVNSAVIRLRPRSLATPARNPRQLENLLKLGFGNRRKMLRNNLKSLLTPDELSQHLIALDANPQARAENLSLEQWIALSDRLDSQPFAVNSAPISGQSEATL